MGPASPSHWGVEMNPEEGMILFDDMNVIEVESGVMYLTCLYNFAQPLIRYRISDSLVLQAAGRTAPIHSQEL